MLRLQAQHAMAIHWPCCPCKNYMKDISHAIFTAEVGYDKEPSALCKMSFCILPGLPWPPACQSACMGPEYIADVPHEHEMGSACMQDHGKTSATASLGMITLWDVEGGLPQIDKYLYSRDNHVVAGTTLHPCPVGYLQTLCNQQTMQSARACMAMLYRIQLVCIRLHHCLCSLEMQPKCGLETVLSGYSSGNIYSMIARLL